MKRFETQEVLQQITDGLTLGEKNPLILGIEHVLAKLPTGHPITQNL